MALPVNGSTHLIPAYYSFYRPRKDERLSWPSWLTLADGLPTLVVTHQLQVERRTGKVRRPETDVLPLCHATNYRRNKTKEILLIASCTCFATIMTVLFLTDSY